MANYKKQVSAATRKRARFDGNGRGCIRRQDWLRGRDLSCALGAQGLGLQLRLLTCGWTDGAGHRA